MNRAYGSVVAAALAAVIGGTEWARAGRTALPATLSAINQHIALGSPTLPPLCAHRVLPAL
ncbi:hypothetical protein ACVWWG_000849 [Bradyrhizobium sp. LB7.2]